MTDDVPAPDDPAALVRASADVGLLDVAEADADRVELDGDEEDTSPYAAGTFAKVGSGMAVLVALVAAPYAAPDLDAKLARSVGVCSEPEPGVAADDCSFARAWLPGEPVPFWNVIGRELMGEGAVEEEAAAQVEETQELAAALLDRDDTDVPLPDKVIVTPPTDGTTDAPPPYTPHEDDGLEVPRALELPSGDALDPFFAALARSDIGYEGAITRVSQWGDSVMSADNVTSALRTSMQRRFGDAGHGFHLLAPPNNSYRHRGIRFKTSEWQHCYIINKCKPDAHFGFGGTTVWSGGGAQSVYRTVQDAAFGRSWSRAELWYAEQPAGGKIRLDLDGGEPTFVQTRGEALTDRWFTLAMEDGPHRLKVKAAGEGRVRMHGIVFERDVPGVVWDGMEQLGAFTSRMMYFDEAHLRAQVEHRDPDLLVFMFGGNDLTLSARNVARYEDIWKDALERFRGPADGVDGVPARPCLLIAPVDHGKRKGQQIISDPAVAEIVSRQRRAALAAGCAFFDTPAAMGGEGAAGRWRKADKPLMAGDLAHLTHAGQKVIGHYVYLALMAEYVAYRARSPGASPSP